MPGTHVFFSIWDTRVKDYQAFAAASPGLDNGWRQQEKDGVPVGREPDHPVVAVDWEDALAFCHWLAEKEAGEGRLPPGAKYRLPRDEEWTIAVGLPTEQGATPEENSGKNDMDFPWGKDWPPPPKAGNYADETFHAKFPVNEATPDDWNKNHWLAGYEDGYATTSPVGSYAANRHGLYDMGGNVWQWCEDWWNAEHKERVLRGASWNIFYSNTLRSSFRMHAAPGLRSDRNGFRCVLELPEGGPRPPGGGGPRPADENRHPPPGSRPEKPR